MLFGSRRCVFGVGSSSESQSIARLKPSALRCSSVRFPTISTPWSAEEDGPAAPSDTGQMRTVLSYEPLTTCLPSGLTATESTKLVCPFSSRTREPSAIDQMRTVLSPEPLTTCLPAGQTATESTQFVCLFSARSPVGAEATLRLGAIPNPEEGQEKLKNEGGNVAKGLSEGLVEMYTNTYQTHTTQPHPPYNCIFYLSHTRTRVPISPPSPQ